MHSEQFTCFCCVFYFFRIRIYQVCSYMGTKTQVILTITYLCTFIVTCMILQVITLINWKATIILTYWNEPIKVGIKIISYHNVIPCFLTVCSRDQSLLFYFLFSIVCLLFSKLTYSNYVAMLQLVLISVAITIIE